MPFVLCGAKMGKSCYETIFFPQPEKKVYFCKMKPYEEMKLIDITNMCSHLQQKLFDEAGEYHQIWLALQEDEGLTAVVRSRQLHIYRNEKHPEGELSTADFKSNKAKKVLVLAGKSAPKIVREDRICEMLKQVETTELVRTSQSWDGAALPDYPQGRPELVAVKYVFPAGKKLGWHHHDMMNCGVLVQGELTIIARDGTEKVVHEGEAVVEMVGTVHHGENRGTKSAILYMFYLSQKGVPLSIQHSENK